MRMYVSLVNAHNARQNLQYIQCALESTVAAQFSRSQLSSSIDPATLEGCSALGFAHAKALPLNGSPTPSFLLDKKHRIQTDINSKGVGPLNKAAPVAIHFLQLPCDTCIAAASIRIVLCKNGCDANFGLQQMLMVTRRAPPLVAPHCT